MSALPPKADMCGANHHICFGPKADIADAFFFTRYLANRFGDDPCPIAPFTGLIALLARLVYLLSGPMAVGADILAGARRAGFWIVLRSVMF